MFCSALALVLGALIAFVNAEGLDNGMIAGKTMNGKTTVHRSWYGGFVGELDIPIENPASAWEATLKFRRRIFELKVSNAEIVHSFNKKKFRIRSLCNNGTFEAGDTIHSFFYADTWDEVKGLKGNVQLTPYFAARE